ncbi:MAG: HD-GYP domain-containing protein [Candidatus Omnitrophica bacterium]|nr:HD-GYP domain-containing protein [Candidatus Omnitrophota bacterium]
MIRIHDPAVLIRVIIRLIIRKVHVKHAGVLIFDINRNCYVLTISGGAKGARIPQGFAKFVKDNPLIKFFVDKKYQSLIKKRGVLTLEDLNQIIRSEHGISQAEERKAFLNQLASQMEMFNVTACIPAYFRDSLTALLLLGEKDGRRVYHEEELDFLAALSSDVAMALQNAQLIKDLQKQVEKNKALFINTTLSLASTIEAKDRYTRGHTERVTKYTLAIANELSGRGKPEVTKNFLENLYIASLLHDIGKIGVPENVLTKESGLTDEEFEQIRQHPLRGADILKNLPDFEECLKGVKYHHECYDGRGYPEGLKGDEIPLIAAIVAVADSYDAMTSDRTYRKALSKEKAMDEISRNSGTQFHPLVAEVFVEILKREKI